MPVDAYGVGSSLIRGSNDFTADIVMCDGRRGRQGRARAAPEPAPEPRAADERHEPHALELGERDALGRAVRDDEPLLAVLDRRDEPPARRELVGERGRDRAARRRGDVDRLVRRVRGEAARAVADRQRHVLARRPRAGSRRPGGRATRAPRSSTRGGRAAPAPRRGSRSRCRRRARSRRRSARAARTSARPPAAGRSSGPDPIGSGMFSHASARSSARDEALARHRRHRGEHPLVEHVPPQRLDQPLRGGGHQARPASTVAEKSSSP